MAITFEALAGQLTMNVSGWEKGLNKAGADFRSFLARSQADFAKLRQASQQLWSAMSSGADKMAAAAGAAAAALAAVTTASVKVGADFEQTMSRVGAVSNATADQMVALGETAELLGEQTVFSANDAAEAMAFFGLAGFKAEKIIAAMPATLNLAAAGQLQISEAADIAAKIMAGMGVEADDLGHAMDVMAKAFTTSNTDLRQLGEAMKFVGPIAAAAGKGLEETVAPLQVMSNAGIQASMAGTSLRGILSKLSQNGREVQKVFGGLGVATQNVDGSLRPLADIIDDFNAALQSQGREAEATGLLMQAFGERAGPGFATLLAAGGDELRKFEAALQDSAGTAERIAGQQLDNLRGSFTLLESVVEGVQIGIAKRLNPSIRANVDELTAWIGKNKEAIEGRFEQGWILLGDAAERFGQALAATWSRVAPTLQALGDRLTAVYQRGQQLFSAMPQWAQDAAILVGGLVLLGSVLTKVGGAIPIVGGLFAALGNVINPLSILGTLLPAVSGALGMFTAAADIAATGVLALSTGIVGGLTSALQGSSAAVTTANTAALSLAAAQAVATNRAARKAAALQEVQEEAKEASGSVAALTSTLLANIAAANGATGAIIGYDGALGALNQRSLLAQSASVKLDAALGMLGNGSRVAAEGLDGALGMTAAKTIAPLDDLAWGVTRLDDAAVSMALSSGDASVETKGLAATLLTFAAPVAVVTAGVVAIGAGLALAIKNSEAARKSISDAFSTIKSTAQNLLQGTLSRLQDFWDTHRESLIHLGERVAVAFSELAEIFEALAQLLGYVLGPAFEAILSTVGLLVDAIDFLASLLTGDFAGAWQAVRNMVADVVDVFEGLLGWIPGVGSALRALSDSIRGNSDETRDAKVATDELTEAERLQEEQHKKTAAAAREESDEVNRLAESKRRFSGVAGALMESGNRVEGNLQAGLRVANNAFKESELGTVGQNITTAIRDAIEEDADSITESAGKLLASYHEVFDHMLTDKQRENWNAVAVDIRAQLNAIENAPEEMREGMLAGLRRITDRASRVLDVDPSTSLAESAWGIAGQSPTPATMREGSASPSAATSGGPGGGQSSDPSDLFAGMPTIANEESRRSAAESFKTGEPQPNIVGALDPVAMGKMHGQQLAGASRDAALVLFGDMRSKVMEALRPDENGIINQENAQRILANYQVLLAQIPGFTESKFREAAEKAIGQMGQLASAGEEMRGFYTAAVEEALSDGEQIFAQTSAVLGEQIVALQEASADQVQQAIGQRAALLQEGIARLRNAGAGIGDLRQMAELRAKAIEAMRAIQGTSGEARKAAIENAVAMQRAYEEAFQKIADAAKEGFDKADEAGKSVTEKAEQRAKEREERIKQRRENHTGIAEGGFNSVAEIGQRFNTMLQGAATGALNMAASGTAALGEMIANAANPVERLNLAIQNVTARLGAMRLNNSSLADMAPLTKGLQELQARRSAALKEQAEQRTQASESAKRQFEQRKAQELMDAREARRELGYDLAGAIAVGKEAPIEMHFHGVTDTRKFADELERELAKRGKHKGQRRTLETR